MTAPTANRLLEVEQVAVAVGGKPILHGVDLSVSPGQAVGLVGETGCGKSMTVRTVTGLLTRIGGRVHSGAVRLGGEDLTGANERRWRDHQGRTVALVPQASMSSLDPLQRIGRQLAETIRRADRRADVARESRRSLQAVHLDPSETLLRSYPHELSGGMRQRVMIALALAVKPRLLVADEPTTALDAAIRRSILELLTELRLDHGLGLLLVSHDIGAIAAATDALAVMYAGRTVESGPTDQVLARPAHPYTAALLACLPERGRPGEPLPVIPGSVQDLSRLPRGCPFAPRCVLAQPDCLDDAVPSLPVGPGRLAACRHAPAQSQAEVSA